MHKHAVAAPSCIGLTEQFRNKKIVSKCLLDFCLVLKQFQLSSRVKQTGFMPSVRTQSRTECLLHQLKCHLDALNITVTFFDIFETQLSNI